jgi:UDP-GlcNAc:undecaprenyl-phosphate GlcNAc-1-phosphate transferase
LRSGFVAFFLAALVATVLTPVMRALAKRLGVVDRPNEARKIHKEPVPRLGGIAILLGVATPLVGLYFYRNGLSEVIYADGHRIVSFLAAALLVVVAGVLDDVRGLAQRYRLAVEAMAGALIYWGGWRVDGLALPWLGHLPLGYLALPATALWVVAVINALNFTDGLDGLAAGTAVIAGGALFLLALHYNNFVAGLFSAAIAGGAFGFLLFNFHPATVYMGDTGSMFLGLALAVASIGASQKDATVVALLGPTLALGLPIGDTVLRVVRRVILGQPWLPADRKHVHHRLLDLGLSHRNATLTLYCAGVVFALAALVISLDNRWMALGVCTFIAGCVVFAVRQLGFAEFNRFGEMRRRQSGGAEDRLIREVEGRLRGVQSLRSVDELWGLTQGLADDLRLDRVEWTLALASRNPRQLCWERPTAPKGSGASALVWTPEERESFSLRLLLDAGRLRYGTLELIRYPRSNLPFTSVERLAARAWAAALLGVVQQPDFEVDARVV